MTRVLNWKRKESKRLSNCKVFEVFESISISPMNNQEHSFYYIDTADWVNVIPVTSNNEIVMVRQFRHGSQQVSLEIPGGLVDPGEQPEVAAVRECLEETGYTAGSILSLGALNPNPALFANSLHTFIAEGCELTSEIKNTNTEFTEVELINFAKLPELLSNGTIDHALVNATLWKWLYQKQVN
mgnify:CR=1 FL=1